MTEPTAKTHVYVGMFRPRYEDLPRKPGCDFLCPCGKLHFLSDGERDCWNAGHFDEPVYVTIEEALMAKERSETCDA